MLDDQFALRLQELETAGDMKARNDFIKENGGMRRLIALAVRGVGASVPKPNKPRAPRSTDEPEGFAEWYAAYPRHVARSAAAAAYRRAVKRVSFDALLASARRYAEECAGNDPQFTKHPASWLNGGCWEDDPVGLTLVPTTGPIDKSTMEAWISRLTMFYGKDPACPVGTWSQKWGTQPGQGGCRVPREAMDAFTAKFPSQATGR
jgi:hypothetical protein